MTHTIGRNARFYLDLKTNGEAFVLLRADGVVEHIPADRIGDIDGYITVSIKTGDPMLDALEEIRRATLEATLEKHRVKDHRFNPPYDYQRHNTRYGNKR